MHDATRAWHRSKGLTCSTPIPKQEISDGAGEKRWDALYRALVCWTNDCCTQRVGVGKWSIAFGSPVGAKSPVGTKTISFLVSMQGGRKEERERVWCLFGEDAQRQKILLWILLG